MDYRHPYMAAGKRWQPCSKRRPLAQPDATHCMWVYESGPCGYVVWRHLRPQGVHREAVAPLSIAHPSGNGVKTDRRDAMLLGSIGSIGNTHAPQLQNHLRVAVSNGCVSRKSVTP